MSTPVTGPNPSRSAANDTTPLPQPRSRSDAGSICWISSRHWRVLAWPPVPKAMPASITTSSRPSRRGYHGRPDVESADRLRPVKAAPAVLPAGLLAGHFEAPQAAQLGDGGPPRRARARALGPARTRACRRRRVPASPTGCSPRSTGRPRRGCRYWRAAGSAPGAPARRTSRRRQAAVNARLPRTSAAPPAPACRRQTQRVARVRSARHWRKTARTLSRKLWSGS